MKIEKINDKQIRCTLTKEDLEERQIKLSELVYGGEKARGLFRDMISEATSQFGFEMSATQPLMIEAVPTANGHLVLIITRVDNPEELDTRFSRFSLDGKEKENTFASLAETLTGADDVLNILKKLSQARNGGLGEDDDPEDGKSDQKSDQKSDPKTDAETDSKTDQKTDLKTKQKSGLKSGKKPDQKDDVKQRVEQFGKMLKETLQNAGAVKPAKKVPQPMRQLTEEELYQYTRFYLFRDLKGVLDAARRIGDEYNGENTLYKNPDDGAYYLLIRKSDTKPEQFNRICNALSEYAMPMDYATGMDEFFREHMKIIVSKTALQSLQKV